MMASVALWSMAPSFLNATGIGIKIPSIFLSLGIKTPFGFGSHIKFPYPYRTIADNSTRYAFRTEAKGDRNLSSHAGGGNGRKESDGNGSDEHGRHTNRA